MTRAKRGAEGLGVPLPGKEGTYDDPSEAVPGVSRGFSSSKEASHKKEYNVSINIYMLHCVSCTSIM
jgi:hypothetical protein